MKRLIIALIISLITLLVSSCGAGCNCPGGAGYGQIEIPITNQPT